MGFSRPATLAAFKLSPAIEAGTADAEISARHADIADPISVSEHPKLVVYLAFELVLRLQSRCANNWQSPAEFASIPASLRRVLPKPLRPSTSVHDVGLSVNMLIPGKEKRAADCS